MGEADGVAVGLTDVGVVEEPVDGAVANVCGISLSNPDGWRFEERAMERVFS